jgi:hypothetical protein
MKMEQGGAAEGVRRTELPAPCSSADGETNPAGE